MIQPAVVLDGQMGAASARNKLVAAKGMAWVIIRRQVGIEVYWYALYLTAVVKRLGETSDRFTVTDTLNLHETDASPVVAATETNDASRRRPTVIVDHDLPALEFRHSRPFQSATFPNHLRTF